MKSNPNLTISFYLKNKNATESPLILKGSYGKYEVNIKGLKKEYTPLLYYTPIKVNVKDWDTVNNEPKTRQLKNEISNIEKTLHDVFDYLELGGEEITNDKLKNALDEKLKGKQKVDVLRIRIIDFIDEVLLKSDEFEIRTKEHYKTVRNRIKEFEKKTGKPLYAIDVNEDLFKLYMDIIKERVTRMNTVWTNKKDFLSVLNKISDKYDINLFKPKRTLNKKLKVKSVKEENIYFTFEQIQKILDHVPQDDEMKNVRLTLLTLIFCGCRYSDVFKIKPQFEYELKDIKFSYSKYITKKGSKDITVPILKPLMKEFTLNGGNSATEIPYDEFRIFLKVLMSNCGFKDNLSMSYTNAYGVTCYETRPFNKFVTSHIGRRTFVSIFRSFIPDKILTKITGHEFNENENETLTSNKSMINLYDKTNKLQNAVHFIRLLKRAKEDFSDIITLDLV